MTLAFYLVLIPELYAAIYYLYFIFFKKDVRPNLRQWINTLLCEAFCAIGIGLMVFYVGGSLDGTAFVVSSLYVTATPLVFSLMTNDLKYRGKWTIFGQLERWFEVRNRTGYNFVALVIRLAGVAAFIVGLVFLSSLKSHPTNSDVPSSAAIAMVLVICLVLVSIRYWSNYASVCAFRPVREDAFNCKGHRFNAKNSNIQENLKTEGAAWCGVSGVAIRIALFLSIYAGVIVSAGSSPFEELKTDECNLVCSELSCELTLNEAIFRIAITTPLLSYFSKTAVRINSQMLGSYLPNLVGLISAFCILAHRENSWGMVVPFLFGIFQFFVLTTHLLDDDYLIYPLERKVFDFASYTPLFTNTMLMLNRKVVEVEEEVKNILLKDAEENSHFIISKCQKLFGGVKDKVDTLGRRKTQDAGEFGQSNMKRFSYDKSYRWSSGQRVPLIYVCTTLWHEEDFEMATMLRSVIKLIKHRNAKEKRAQRAQDNEDAKHDYFNMEVHIFFDNVFDDNDIIFERDTVKVLNKWVCQFLDELEKALSLFGLMKKDRDSNDTILQRGRVVLTPYGGRLEYDIEGTQFVVHLKDAEKVQRGKRWSQVMYLYYLIGWKIDATDEMEISGAYEKLEKDKCFILALDGDVDFDPPALEIVLNRLKRNDHVAACCSQIHPMGSSWLVMYQRFEYAVGHWLQKTTEHVLGCVLCSPGCFSLVRISHLARPNVMAMYKSLASTPLEKLQFDQGEDRWLCTLMLTSGGRIEFEASAHCNTFAPEDLPTFYKQRRRWGPSTTANVWQLILNQFDARKNNPYISLPYVLYHLFMLMFSIIGVSTTMMMVAEAFYIALGYNLDKGFCYLIVMAPVVIFCIACYLSGNGDLQIKLASWLSLMFSFLMLIVLIGIIMEGVNCPFSPSFLFFVGLAAVHIVAGLLHFDVKSLFCGVVYFLFIPSCFIFLQIYSIANLNDFSWGTRQAPSKAAASDNRSFFQKIMGAEIKEEDPVDPVQKDGYGCHCNLCPTIVPAKNTKFYAPNDDNKPKIVTSEFQSQVCDNDFIPDAPDRISIEEIPPDTQELAYMIEDEFDEQFLQENIMKESYYGGETVHELKKSEFTQWTKLMTNCENNTSQRLKMNPEQPSDPKMSFSYGWLYNREIESFKREGKFVNESERMKLEKAKRIKTEKDYLGWVVSNKSPINDNCTVHVLSNPEYIFWRDMVDPTDGYIGLKSNGEKYEELVENEKQLVKDVNEFRAEKYGLYLFINTVWVVISTIVLKYSAELLQIPIKVPNIAKCDNEVESEEGSFGILFDGNFSRDYNENYNGGKDDDWAEIKLQPLSLFFLAFYVILIIAQFICMLWHRVSTYYHFVADVDISMQRREIERKKRAALEASLTAEGEKIEDIDKTASERKLEEINRAFLDDEGPGPDSDPGAGGNMHAKQRRKSTIRFENVSSDDDDDDNDEGDRVEIIQPTEDDIRKMIERRQERRKSSIFHGEGSILFAASKEQSRFQQSRLNSPMLQKIRQKSSANIYGKSPLSVQTSYGDDDVFSEAGDFINKEHSPIEPAARPSSENSSTVSNGQEKKFLKNYMRISYTTTNKIDLTDITESDADDSSYGSQHSGEASNGSETNTPRGVGFAFPQATIPEPQQIPQTQPPLLYAKNPRIQQLRSRSPFPSVDC